MKLVALTVAGSLLLAAFGLYPFSGGKLSDLQPVQVLVAEQLPQGVRLSTDNGLAGYGGDYPSARKDLEQTAPGRTFFACCSAVVICGGEELLRAVAEDSVLRPAAAVYLAPSAPNPAQVKDLLQAHSGSVRLADVQRSARSLPLLILSWEGWRVEHVS